MLLYAKYQTEIIKNNHEKNKYKNITFFSFKWIVDSNAILKLFQVNFKFRKTEPN